MEEKEPLTNNTTNDETTQPETNEQEVQNQADTATEATEAPATELTDAEKLAQAEAEIAELKDKILRQAADFANFRNSHRVDTQWWQESARKSPSHP